MIGPFVKAVTAALAQGDADDWAVELVREGAPYLATYLHSAAAAQGPGWRDATLAALYMPHPDHPRITRARAARTEADQ